ncbi:NAD(P)-dependent oxidoreductase [Sporomusa sp. GT1]|uniref:NAD(P)-dependent oxidoreductase n=1 Tax=Sporomusa sp. GT1 TaxID=1534747 RepID=UPI001CB7BFD9
MYVKLCGLHEVLQCSDFVSLHLPLTPNTNQLISHSAISKMKKGSYCMRCRTHSCRKSTINTR